MLIRRDPRFPQHAGPIEKHAITTLEPSHVRVRLLQQHGLEAPEEALELIALDRQQPHLRFCQKFQFKFCHNFCTQLRFFFPLLPRGGEGPPTAIKTSAPAKGRAAWEKPLLGLDFFPPPPKIHGRL